MSFIEQSEKVELAKEYRQALPNVSRALVQLHAAIVRAKGLRENLFAKLTTVESETEMAAILPIAAKQWADKDPGLNLNGLEILDASMREAAAMFPRDPTDPSAGALSKNELLELLKDAE